MFQARHYVELARIISELPDEQRPNVAEHFTRELRGTNPNYSAERFHAAALGKPLQARDRAK